MQTFVRTLIAVLALGLPVLGSWTDQAGQRLVVTPMDTLVAIDPKTGSSRTLLHLKGLSGMDASPLGGDVWLLQEVDDPPDFDPAENLNVSTVLRAVDASGRILFTHRFPGKIEWGPEKQENGELALVRQAHAGAKPQLVFLKEGKETAVWELPGLPKAVFRVEGNWLMQIPPKEPEEPDYGFKRPPANPPVPKEEPEQLVLLSGKTGELLWSLQPEGRIQDGPWMQGERLLEVEEGGDDPPFYLVSLEPVPQIVKTLDRPWNYPIQELPAYQWTLPLQGRPLAEPARLAENRLLVIERTPSRDRLVVVEEDQGDVQWEAPLDLPVALDAAGKPAVLELEGQLRVLLQGDKVTRVLSLNPLTGQPEGEFEVAGVPVTLHPHEDRLFGFFKTVQAEPALDTGGHPIYNLNKRTPETNFVESYRLVELGDEPRVLMDGPRDSLVDEPVLEQGTLYYATRLTPVQKEGEPRRIDLRYPQEPTLLHAVDLGTGQERWVYRPATGSERILGGWSLKEGKILFSCEPPGWNVWGSPARRVAQLDAAGGKLDWMSPPLKDAPDELDAVGDLWLAQVGDRYYGLDRESGRFAWRPISFVPLFDFAKLNSVAGVTLLVVCIAYYIYHARRKELFIRRIAGLNALDEAVGRATEMGKPVLYVHGLADVDDIQILASLSILGHVARKTAEYDTPILVPCSRSVVMSTAQEVVKEAYTAAGRPDAFHRDNINYLTDEQFGYVAGVDGIMLREKPAANFYLGCFYAESLILAETGHSTGAIQIAGTAMPAQLPFFVAACDYTLIGEELYAASAYLSRDPMQVGSLKGQDVGKAVIMTCIFLGAVLFSLGVPILKEWLKT
ncbi:MAG: DUF6754 domain-containing protein [Candidatus Eremiobacterota bacterium]